MLKKPNICIIYERDIPILADICYISKKRKIFQTENRNVL